MSRILVVDDDENVSGVLARYLERAGHEVDTVADGTAAVVRATQTRPDLMILDLMLPGLSGLEVCRQVQADRSIPTIMLTARGDEHDRVVGFELGADDYITKPFSPRELVLRVGAVLRRAGAPNVSDGPVLVADGDLTIDKAAHEVRLRDQVISLTSREYDLLLFLLQHPRVAFTREELCERVWGWSHGDVSTVTVHVRRLREKIEADAARPQRLVTVWGVGYRYEHCGVAT